MANILLGVTGSVAAIRTPLLFSELSRLGHQVKVVATDHALYFFNPLELDSTRKERNREILILDEDEWSGKAQEDRYRRGDPVLHIELRRWADLFLIAPLDANTLAKFVHGFCDNCLTCVWRAWDLNRPVVVAPAMNTMMWTHPLTKRQLRSLAIDFGAAHIPSSLDEEKTISGINDRCRNFRIIPPISKELACGDVGIGAMAEVSQIIDQTLLMLS
jgi:phosphopantothenoylcysteine decarboxylase